LVHVITYSSKPPPHPNRLGSYRALVTTGQIATRVNTAAPDKRIMFQW